jgi:hypothetical protein
MSSRSAESGGLSDFKVLRERQDLSPRVLKPEEPKQQPVAPDPTVFERFHRERRRRRSGVLGGHNWNLPENHIQVQQSLPQKLSEQRGELEASKPSPAEQQAAEQLGKPPPAVNELDSSPQEQDEPQASGQEEPDDLDFDIDFKPLPPATWVGPFGRSHPKRTNNDNQK